MQQRKDFSDCCRSSGISVESSEPEYQTWLEWQEWSSYVMPAKIDRCPLLYWVAQDEDQSIVDDEKRREKSAQKVFNLLNFKANPNETNDLGDSALFIAIFIIIKWLIPSLNSMVKLILQMMLVVLPFFMRLVECISILPNYCWTAKLMLEYRIKSLDKISYFIA
eukprot:UN28660